MSLLQEVIHPDPGPSQVSTSPACQQSSTWVVTQPDTASKQNSIPTIISSHRLKKYTHRPSVRVLRDFQKQNPPLPPLMVPSLRRVKLAHLNACYLENMANLIEVREFAPQHNIGMLTVSESWLKSTISNHEINIRGYKVHKLD